MGGEPAALVRTTVAATMQQGGTAANVLPSQASATLNLRIALGETVAGTVRRVRRRIHDPLVEVDGRRVERSVARVADRQRPVRADR